MHTVFGDHRKLTFTKLSHRAHIQMNANFRWKNSNSHQNFTPDKNEIALLPRCDIAHWSVKGAIHLLEKMQISTSNSMQFLTKVFLWKKLHNIFCYVKIFCVINTEMVKYLIGIYMAFKSYLSTENKTVQSMSSETRLNIWSLVCGEWSGHCA